MWSSEHTAYEQDGGMHVSERRETDMCQSRVEIKCYYIAYFDHITASYCSTPIKGGAHICFVDLFMHLQSMYDPYNGSSAIWRFSNVNEISDGITFNFCTGLSYGDPSSFISFLTPSSPPLCSVLCGPVSSSIFVEDCKNCTFVAACQQV